MQEQGDHRVRIELTGQTRQGRPFQRVVDRTYTVTPDAEVTQPVILRAMGTHLMLRGARTFGLQTGLTVYVHDPQGRRVARGVLTNITGNTAAVNLQGVHSGEPITSQYTIRFNMQQWRSDQP
jgi:hypothetical protein